MHRNGQKLTEMGTRMVVFKHVFNTKKLQKNEPELIVEVLAGNLLFNGGYINVIRT